MGAVRESASGRFLTSEEKRMSGRRPLQRRKPIAGVMLTGAALCWMAAGCSSPEQQQPSPPKPERLQFRAPSGYVVAVETWETGGSVQLRAQLPANWVEVVTEALDESSGQRGSRRVGKTPRDEASVIGLMQKHEVGYLFALEIAAKVKADDRRTFSELAIKASCLSHSKMKPVVVTRSAQQWNDEAMRGVAKELAGALEEALGDQKPLTKEILAERQKETTERPVLELLVSADKEQHQGRTDKAWEVSGRALERAKATGSEALVSRVDGYRGQLRPTYVSWLTSTAAKQIEAGRVEDAAQSAKLLGAFPEEAEQVAKLKAAIAEKTPSVVSALVAQAQGLGEDECWKAYDLVDRAHKLDASNQEVKKLRSVLRKTLAARMPTYIKDVYAQVEGNGFVVYYVLCNSVGKMVAAPGKATVTFYGESSGVVTGEYGQFTEEVATGDFEAREVGVRGAGGEKLMHVCKRLPWTKLKGRGPRNLQRRDRPRAREADEVQERHHAHGEGRLRPGAWEGDLTCCRSPPSVGTTQTSRLVESGRVMLTRAVMSAFRGRATRVVRVALLGGSHALRPMRESRPGCESSRSSQSALFGQGVRGTACSSPGAASREREAGLAR